MSKHRFKTPGGEVVEEKTEEFVFYRTKKGEDLYAILLLIEERAQTTDEARRAEIIRQIEPLKAAFQAEHGQDPIDLIVELFGEEEGEGE